MARDFSRLGSGIAIDIYRVEFVALNRIRRQNPGSRLMQ